MSRQQTRSSGDGAIDPSLVQKKRARHRLVGAISLCVLAAIIVPLVLESEPRPRDRNLPIEFAAPAHGVSPQASHEPVAAAEGGSAGASALAPAPAAPGPSGKSTASGSTASGAIGGLGSLPLGPPTEAAAGTAPSQSGVRTITPPAVTAAAEPPAGVRPPPKAKADAAKGDAAKAEAPRTEAGKSDAARNEAARGTTKPPAAQEKTPSRSAEPDVLAKLIDRADAPASSTAGAAPGGAAARDGAAKAAAPRKFLVQIGAYSNVQSARSMSDRAVQAGLRPYQETVKTAQGDWIRVRVGPFTSRQDAERAQQELKRAGVTAAIIAL